MLSVAMVVLKIQQILEFMSCNRAIYQQVMNCVPVAFPFVQRLMMKNNE
jgi:hypothetical protein